jgi:hypothetical protein
MLNRQIAVGMTENARKSRAASDFSLNTTRDISRHRSGTLWILKREGLPSIWIVELVFPVFCHPLNRFDPCPKAVVRPPDIILFKIRVVAPFRLTCSRISHSMSGFSGNHRRRSHLTLGLDCKLMQRPFDLSLAKTFDLLPWILLTCIV